VRRELIFDPATSELLGETERVVHGGTKLRVPAGTVIGWSVYLGSWVAPSTARPPRR
jgi:hypothetical protein